MASALLNLYSKSLAKKTNPAYLVVEENHKGMSYHFKTLRHDFTILYLHMLSLSMNPTKTLIWKTATNIEFMVIYSAPVVDPKRVGMRGWDLLSIVRKIVGK